MLVAANKQPELGPRSRGASRLPGRCGVSDTRIPRGELIGLMGRARVTVLVPNPKEGFYLPASRRWWRAPSVVCPDCVGNRSYCLDGQQFVPARPTTRTRSWRPRSGRSPARRCRARLTEAAGATADAHDLAVERRAFLEILDRVDELWAAA